MKTYSTLEEYTADVVKAREAYRLDELSRAGICVTCENRSRDGRHRECKTCRRQRCAV